MQRRQLSVFGMALILLAFGFGLSVGKDSPQIKSDKAVPAPKPDPKAAVPVDSKSGDKLDSKEVAATAEQASPEERAIAATAEEFIAAFNKSDAKAVAALFTADAEYIDEQGNRVRGREAIEKNFEESFAANPKGKIEMSIDAIRVVSPNVAIEDGITLIRGAEGDHLALNRYSAVHAKSEGKWLVASVRESAAREIRQHRSRLQQMAWLTGDWVDETDGSVVLFECKPVDDGNFLLRKFAIQIAGKVAMSGVQRTGWDPLAGRFRAWTFDSEGGFSEGFWYRDGNHWELKAIGVTADGQTASSTTIYTLVDENTMTWQSVDHEVGGVQLPDSDPVTIVRRGPLPAAADETAMTKSK